MKTRRTGFTLIEVLVALAIVAIGMAAVLGALSSSANTVLYLRDKMLAEWVGLNQIATTRLALQPGQVPPTGNTTGDLDYAGRSWHWRQDVVPTQVTGIVRIDVKVRPAEVKAGDDDGWFATVSGIAGDALAASQGTTPTWGAGNLPGQGGAQCQQGVPCNNQPCQPGLNGQPGATGQPGTNGQLGPGGQSGCQNQQQPCNPNQLGGCTNPGVNGVGQPPVNGPGLGGGSTGGLGGDTGGGSDTLGGPSSLDNDNQSQQPQPSGGLGSNP